MTTAASCSRMDITLRQFHRRSSKRKLEVSPACEQSSTWAVTAWRISALWKRSDRSRRTLSVWPRELCQDYSVMNTENSGMKWQSSCQPTGTVPPSDRKGRRHMVREAAGDERVEATAEHCGHTRCRSGCVLSVIRPEPRSSHGDRQCYAVRQKQGRLQDRRRSSSCNLRISKTSAPRGSRDGSSSPQWVFCVSTKHPSSHLPRHVSRAVVVVPLLDLFCAFHSHSKCDSLIVHVTRWWPLRRSATRSDVWPLELNR